MGLLDRHRPDRDGPRRSGLPESPGRVQRIPGPGASDPSSGHRLAVQAELQRIRDAVLQYMADTGQAPPGNIEALMRVLVPRYLPRAVTETHGMPIQCFVEGNRFELRAAGPDGQFRTEDDVVVGGP